MNAGSAKKLVAVGILPVMLAMALGSAAVVASTILLWLAAAVTVDFTFHPRPRGYRYLRGLVGRLVHGS
ncbi:hypothetical protein [Nocardia sp. NPDC050710]|uniref:hypothetical protein n=1 Tax=Nocardia sp. NPDC050710 TaxID=3157220 RepID=UPI0034101C94